MKNNSTLKRIFAAVCAAVIISSLAACENVSLRSESGTESAREEQLVSMLPDSSQLQGTDVYIAVPIDGAIQFEPNDEAESLLSTAVERRNDLIRNKYGINITEIICPTEQIEAELRKSSSAGTQYADLISYPGTALVGLARNQLLANLLSSPSFNINADYIDSANAKAVTANNSLKFIYSSATQYYNNLWVVYYDKQLVAKSGLEDPAVVASNGKWTWEVFRAYSEKVAENTLAKGSVDIKKDVFGFSSYSNDRDLPLAMWQSSGLSVFEDTYLKSVRVKSDLSDVRNATNILKTIYSSKSRYALDGADAFEAFTDGRLGFFVEKLKYSAALQSVVDNGNYKREWGLLPMPKLTESQKNYISYIDPQAFALAIPANVKDIDKSVMLLNAFCAASGDIIKEGIYTKYVNTFFQNNSSTVMLKTILNTGHADFAALYGTGIDRVASISTDILIEAISKNGAVERPISDKLKGFESYSKEIFG